MSATGENQMSVDSGLGRVAGGRCRSTAGRSCPAVTRPVLAEAAEAPRYLVEG